MEYNVGTFFIGLLIFAAGAGVVIFYRQISEAIAHGVASYDKVRLFGFVFIGLGFLVMTGLHILILNWLIKIVFPGQ